LLPYKKKDRPLDTDGPPLDSSPASGPVLSI